MQRPPLPNETEADVGDAAPVRPGAVRLVRLFNLDVYVGVGWLLVGGFAVWLLAVRYLPDAYPHWTPAQCWRMAVVIAVFGLVSLIVHELAHAFVAMRRGLPVRRVVVAFVAEGTTSDCEPRTPSAEAAVAVAGPSTSLALAVVLSAIWVGAVALRVEPLAALTGPLALFNLGVAVCSMLPVLPLDGGRLLRAIVWHRSGTTLHGTHVATRSVVPVMILLSALGLLLALSMNSVGGFLLVIVGWLLTRMAPRVYLQQLLRTRLHSVDVASLMERDTPGVLPTTTLSELVSRDWTSPHRRAWFVVSEGGAILGLVTRVDARKVPRDQWDRTSVYRAMTPCDQLVTVPANAGALTALRLMLVRKLDEIAVTSGRDIVGLVTLASVLGRVQSRDTGTGTP